MNGRQSVIDEVLRDAHSVLHDVRSGHVMEAAPTVEHLAGVVGMYRKPEEAFLVARLYEQDALGSDAPAGLVHELRRIAHDPSVALDLDLVHAEEEAEEGKYRH